MPNGQSRKICISAPRSKVGPIAFSPDGRTLATGHADGTILFWPVPPPVPDGRWSKVDANGAWELLIDENSTNAYPAVWQMMDYPVEAVQFLRGKFSHVAQVNADEWNKLIAGLDNPRFAAREAASKRVRELGRSAERPLREALKHAPSPEQVARIEALLVALNPLPTRVVKTCAPFVPLPSSKESALPKLAGCSPIGPNVDRRRGWPTRLSEQPTGSSTGNDMTERERMLAGELYDPLDAELVAARRRARNLIKNLNDSRDADAELRAAIIQELFGSTGEGTWIEPPFFCDYGSNITLGDKVFFNFNCVVLDPAPVDRQQRPVRPSSSDLHRDAPTRCRDAPHLEGIREAGDRRVRCLGWWRPIICPGVTIGDRAVIGAGSVVTRDIPEGVFAAGNPCRVIRELTSSSARRATARSVSCFPTDFRGHANERLGNRRLDRGGDCRAIRSASRGPASRTLRLDSLHPQPTTRQ